MIRLPGETGEMLRTLTSAMRSPATDLIASLIVAQGECLGIDLPIPGVAVTHNADGVHVRFDNCILSPMTAKQLLSFAETIQAVFDRWVEMSDFDTPDVISVRRVGPGFALTIMRPGEAPYRRVFARGVMRALQAKLRTAAKRAATNG
jgi:hypothetical protein